MIGLDAVKLIKQLTNTIKTKRRPNNIQAKLSSLRLCYNTVNNKLCVK